jgi:hypothetical protein
MLNNNCDDSRRCNRCGLRKSLSEFLPGVWNPDNKVICAKYKENKLIELRWCISCLEGPPEYTLPKNLDVSVLEAKGKYLKNRYDLTLKEYEELFNIQCGVCIICHKPPTVQKPFLVVDHDHKTGKVRGLLCDNCNLALGLFGDSAANLQAAARYLNTSHAEDLKTGGPRWRRGHLKDSLRQRYKQENRK